MPKVAIITGLPVHRSGGKRVGWVEHVLFDPQESRVVGYEIERPAIWGLIERRSRFLPLGDTTIGEDGFTVLMEGKKLPSPSVSARASGIDWDQTVIWRDMAVRSESGKKLGRVRDVGYGKKSGNVTRVMLTEGAATDAGVGRRQVDADDIIGFDGERILVKDAVAKQHTGGGAATAAGVGAAVAQDKLNRAATKAAQAGGRLAGKAARRWKQSAKEWKDLLEDD